jgi:hypothetical protein
MLPLAASAAQALRVVYGQGAAKKIARDFGVAVVTAKLWLAGKRKFPMARREDLARRIIAELDRQDQQRAEIRRQWGSYAGSYETNGSMGSVSDHLERTSQAHLNTSVSRGWPEK